MKDRKYFLHLGWSKTATTSLQDVLKEMKNIQYFGRPYSPELFQMMSYFTYANNVFFDDKKFQARRDAMIDGKGPKTLLFSDENLTPDNISNPLRFERIKENFPGAKIILTIRNQQSALKSLYVLKFLRKDRFGTDHFRDWIERGIDDNWEHQFYTYFRSIERGAYICPVAYDYSKTVVELERLFGRKNIKILLFEDFAKNYSGFMEELTSFMGLSMDDITYDSAPWHNSAGIKRVKIFPRKWRKKLMKTGQADQGQNIPALNKAIVSVIDYFETKNGQARLNSIDFSYPEELKRKLISYYEPGNKLIAKNYGLDLSSKGYFE